MPDPALDLSVAAIDTFPLDAPPEEQLSAAVRYAVQAPSGHNTQPWAFRLTGGALELWADRTRALPVVDPDDRELTIACGAALFNVRLTLRRFGRQPLVTLLPDARRPDLLARIRVENACEPTDEERALFDAIPRRRTYRLPFEDRVVSEHVLEALINAASHEEAWFHPVWTDTDRKDLVQTVAEGDRCQMADRSFRRELAAWVHPSRARSRDGMPGSALGLTGLMSAVYPLAVRTFDLGKGRGAKDRELAQRSPVLAVLGSRGDGVADWLAAGQALQRVLLRACVEGVYASFLNQPIEVPALRARIKALVSEPGVPQLILRLGYGRPGARAPRRDVDEVLTTLTGER